MWLVDQKYEQLFRDANAAGIVFSVEDKAQHKVAASQMRATSSPAGYRVEDGVAHIHVNGLLTKEPDIVAWFFDLPNTTYPDIAKAVATAEADSSVSRILYHFDSGGGSVDGLTIARDAIDGGVKPADAVASYSASASYWLMSRVRGSITAEHSLAEFGSIGVAVQIFKSDRVYSITSTNAPNKRPDPATEEGKAAIRDVLDAIHDQFVADIADGRSRALDRPITVETVNNTFGRGGTMLAEQAMRAGMIDAVKSRPKAQRLTGGNPAASNNKADGEIAGADNRGKKMDINQLKSQHPDLYAAVRQEGFDAGVKQERIRVDAHLTLGEASGEMAYAINCTRDGSDVTAVVNAKHFAAVMKGREISAREEDDKSVKAATGDASAVDASEDDALGAQVVAIMKAKRAGGEAA